MFSVSEGVADLFIGLASAVYSVLEKLSQLFFDVSVVQLLDDASISAIYQRVGLILGLFMLFKLTFSFIQMIVDPEQVTDKEKGIGSIIKKILVVILLLGMTPIIFKTGFALQEAIIEDNTIGRIILGDEAGNTSDLGRTFTANLYTSFADEDKREEFTNGLLTNNDNLKLDYSDMDDYLKKSPGTGVGNAFFCLLVGCVAFWMFLMYTISTGLRVVQLMFLELISPVPIISYLSSKKETGLQTWIKQCITTYLDLFIRMAILYFSVLLLHIIVSNNTSAMISSSVGDSSNTLIKIILVLGVLLFMKKAPQLIEELFPGLKTKASGDFGLGLKNRTDMPGLARRAIGGLLGAPIGGVGNAAARSVARMLNNKKNNNPLTEGLGKAFGTGFLSGAGRGFVGGVAAKSGFMGGFNKDARARMHGGNARFLNNEENNYTNAERMQDYLAQKLGFPNYVSQLKAEKAKYEQQAKGNDIVKNLYDDLIKEAKDAKEKRKFVDPKFRNSAWGRDIQDRGIDIKNKEDKIAALRDPNSQESIQYKAECERARNDIQGAKALLASGNVSAADRVTLQQTIDNAQAVLDRQILLEREVADENKQWFKDYVDYATSDQAIRDGAQEQGWIYMKQNAIQDLKNHNAANASIPEAQIYFDLGSSSMSDIDNYRKGKAKYEKISIDYSTGQITNSNGIEVGFEIDPNTHQKVWKCRVDTSTGMVYETNSDGSFVTDSNGDRKVVYLNVAKNGATIDHDSTVTVKEYDRKIKEREEKMNGNKASGSK